MEEEDFVPLSALQHYRYCPRQCALIHVERLWAENRQTAEGRLLHARTDAPLTEQRHGVRTVTAMPLKEAPLGLWGVADVVEFHATATGAIPYPVEYKRGRPKSHRADEVQLCAQALCLESHVRAAHHGGRAVLRRRATAPGGPLRPGPAPVDNRYLPERSRPDADRADPHSDL